MKAIVCEICGGNDLVKDGEYFICQHCGTKYSLEDAKKLYVEGHVDISGSTVKVDDSNAEILGAKLERGMRLAQEEERRRQAQVDAKKAEENRKTLGSCCGYLFLIFAALNLLGLGSGDPWRYIIWILIWGGLGTVILLVSKDIDIGGGNSARGGQYRNTAKSTSKELISKSVRDSTDALWDELDNSNRKGKGNE